jgi:hypothetical protein
MLLNMFFQSTVVGLIFCLLINNNRITYESATLIKVGMSPAEVVQILGEPYPLPGHIFTPIAVTREDGEPKVDAIKITPAFYPIGPGLPSYTLHSRQEEFPPFFGQTNPTNRYNFWLTKSCSILVFYDSNEQVTRVFALPTTVEPGNPFERLQWYVSRLLGR